MFTAYAEGDQLPQTRWRVHNACLDKTKCFAIEIYMPESLTKAAYDALVSNDPNVAKPPIAVIYNSKKVQSDYKVQISEKDILLDEKRRGRLFVIYLPESYKRDKPSQLIYMPYPTDNGDLVFPMSGIGTDYSTSFEFDKRNKIFSWDNINDQSLS